MNWPVRGKAVFLQARSGDQLGLGVWKCSQGVPKITDFAKTSEKLAGAAGLEPVTSAVTGQRSNQLSYAPAFGGVVFSGQNQ